MTERQKRYIDVVTILDGWDLPSKFIDEEAVDLAWQGEPHRTARALIGFETVVEETLMKRNELISVAYPDAPPTYASVLSTDDAIIRQIKDNYFKRRGTR